MPQEKTRKILFTALLCSFSALISTYSIDPNLKSNAYGQTPDPSNSDIGIIPQNNYSQTQVIIYNSTSLVNTPDSLNQTNVGTQNVANENNTSLERVDQSVIPEFGPVAQIILIMATFSVIIFRRIIHN